RRCDGPAARGTLSAGRVRPAGLLCACAQRAPRPGQLLPRAQGSPASVGRDRRHWRPFQAWNEPGQRQKLDKLQSRGQAQPVRLSGHQRLSPGLARWMMNAEDEMATTQAAGRGPRRFLSIGWTVANVVAGAASGVFFAGAYPANILASTQYGAVAGGLHLALALFGAWMATGVAFWSAHWLVLHERFSLSRSWL